MSNTADMLGMSLVLGIRGVGGVCLARGGVGVSGLGLGCTNPVDTVRVLDVCLCLRCGGVGREWVWGMEGWGGVIYVCVSSDSLCILQVQVSVYCARRTPAHLRCIQCSILLHLIDICFLSLFFMEDIANPDLFVCCCRTWLCLDINRLNEEQRHPSSGSAWPACQKTLNPVPVAGGGRF